MNDAPTPDAASSALPAAPRRGATILGRMTSAVREQNWFAIALEVLIVVLGVVIGFQITAWGEARSDRVQERVYLEQLVADLHATEDFIGQADSVNLPGEQANAKLLRAFFSAVPPSRDSALTWRFLADSHTPASPALAVVEALVATGDLAFNRNDSLRSDISTYLVYNRQRVRDAEVQYVEWRQAVYAADARIDFAEVRVGAMGPPAIDSLAQNDPMFTDVTGTRRPFPVNINSMFQDRELYNALRIMNVTRANVRRARQDYSRTARLLREQIEAELNR